MIGGVTHRILPHISGVPHLQNFKMLHNCTKFATNKSTYSKQLL